MGKRFKLPKDVHTCDVLLEFPAPIETVGLWAVAGSWALKNDTGGHVPGYMLQHWKATENQADALEAADIWRSTAPDWSGTKSYQFTDWED